MTLAAQPLRDVDLLEPCMVVEDDSIILIDIEHTLRQLGLSDVRTAASLHHGEALAKLPDIRFAILDYELGNQQNSLGLADSLAARGVCVVFLTAHGADVRLPPSLGHVPVLAKPFTTASLLAMLLNAKKGGQPVTAHCAMVNPLSGQDPSSESSKMLRCNQGASVTRVGDSQ
jgi:CheY-like chemotaxis protein